MTDDDKTPSRPFFRSLSKSNEGDEAADDNGETIPEADRDDASPQDSDALAVDPPEDDDHRRRVLFDPTTLDEGEEREDEEVAADSEEADKGGVREEGGQGEGEEIGEQPTPTLSELRAQTGPNRGEAGVERELPPRGQAPVDEGAKRGGESSIKPPVMEDEDFWENLGATVRGSVPAPETGIDEVMHLVRGERAEPEDPEGSAAEDVDESEEVQDEKEEKGPSVMAGLMNRVSGLRDHFGTRSRSVLIGSVAALSLVVLATFLLFGSSDDHYVHFMIQAGDAESVTVVGDFNDWNPAADSLARLPNTPTWETWVRMGSGNHRYAFLVDGEHRIVDPAHPGRTVDAEDPVSVIRIPEGEGKPEVSNEFRSTEEGGS